MTKHVVLTYGVVFAAIGCSGGNRDDVGRDAARLDAGGGVATQSGTVVAFGTTNGVPGVTVTLGNATGTTDGTGLYHVSVPVDTPYEMTLSAPSYYKTILQEWQLSADVDRGKTNFLTDTQSGMVLQAVSTIGGVPRDPTLGIVAVVLTTQPGCTTTGGGTVSVSPNVSTTRYVYFNDSGEPSTNMSTSANPLPVHVLAYNVPVGAITTSVVSPSCTQAAFPVTADATTFGGSGTYIDTGKARVEAGDAVTYVHLYLGS